MRIYLPIAIAALSFAFRAPDSERPPFADGESALIASLAPPDLDELLGELTAAGMASVKGADYAGGWFNSAVKYDYADEMMVLPSNGNGRNDVDWPGRVGNTWTMPVEGNTNLVRFLAYDCVWWEVARGEDVTATRFNVNCFIPADNGTVRLRREIAKLTFALEENAGAVKPARALAFPCASLCPAAPFSRASERGRADHGTALASPEERLRGAEGVSRAGGGDAGQISDRRGVDGNQCAQAGREKGEGKGLVVSCWRRWRRRQDIQGGGR